MTSLRWSAPLGALAILGACGHAAPAQSPSSAAVALSEAAPPRDYVQIAPVSVTSGKGCGFLGTDGSRSDAERLLRDKAASLQASYVQITEYRKPPLNHQCAEHEHVLSGVAYRKPSSPMPTSTPTPGPSATAAVTPAETPPRFPLVLLDYEGNAALGRPATATATSNIVLALAAGEASPSALSLTYTCSGSEQRANLDVWNDARITDWHLASALTFKIKADAPLVLSVSFLDGHGTGYTQKTETLKPGSWQVVTLPLAKFWHNPFGPPGDQPGAFVDATRVSAFGFAPEGCNSGHFLIDDFQLVR